VGSTTQTVSNFYLPGAPARRVLRDHLITFTFTRPCKRARIISPWNACSHLLACLLAFASMSRPFALLVPLDSCCASPQEKRIFFFFFFF
jgi:hypothetical protein